MFKSKSKFLLLSIIIITLISTLSFATVEPVTSYEANAIPISESDANTTSEDTTNIQEEPEWVNNDLYISGDNYELNKIVDGNVYIIANEVIIKGEVGGNVFVCANKLTIEGAYIYSSLYAIANEITINGIVNDIYSVSDIFNLETDGFVYRDLRAISNTFNINGKVRRDAYLSGTTYNFNDENGALIGGNLKYSSNSELTIPDGIITGEIIHDSKLVEEENISSIIVSYIFNALSNLIFTFVIILLALWLAPKFTNRVNSMNTKKSLICFGIGIITPIVTIVTLMLLLISSVCSTIALAGTFVFIAICMSAKAFTSIYFGNLLTKVFKWEGNTKFVLSCLIASLIIWAISQIPFIGGLFGFLIALFGIGILFVNVICKNENKLLKEANSEKE